MSQEVEFIQFVYIVSEISQPEYVRRLQNSTKEISKIGRRKVHVLSNKQNWCAYFTLLFLWTFVNSSKEINKKL